MKNVENRMRLGTAENAAILLTFSDARLTGRDGEDCYTFEGFASSRTEIHTNYYYHYKRRILGLKEETKWS
jgi:hypothetical protein